MREYIRAEWYLYSRSSTRIVIGMIFCVLYFLAQILCGIMPPGYCVFVVFLGFMAFCLLFYPMYSNSVRISAKGKANISSKKQMLCLGETKRVFLQIRFATFLAILLFLIAGGGLFQSIFFVLQNEMFRGENCLYVVFLLSSAALLVAITTIMLPLNFGAGFVGGAIGYVFGKSVGESMEFSSESKFAKEVVADAGYMTLILFLIYLVVFLTNYYLAFRSEKIRAK